MKIAILGTSPGSLKDAPLEDPGVQCWTGASFYKCYEKLSPCIDLWFELHPDIERLRDGWLGWAVENQPTCYLQEAHHELEHSTRFPIEAITTKFGRYFTSTASFMVATAIDAGATEISIHGVDMLTSSEYVRQRPCFEYMVGVARGAGIEVQMPEGSPMLKCKWIYGYQRPPGGWSSPYKLVRAEGQRVGVTLSQSFGLARQ